MIDSPLFDIPIIFIVFNRPETTKKVFCEIAKIKPKQLFIIADGPRAETESIKCNEVRAITNFIDWECELKTNFSESNLGCKRRLISGLNWAFEQCEQAIILEDDCLPEQSFFPFCKEMLDMYKNDERVMMISGDKIHRDLESKEYSYYFSCYNHIWGWATWKRVWNLYDERMKELPSIIHTDFLPKLLQSNNAANYWRSLFEKVNNNKMDTWDCQLQYLCWIYNGLTIIPGNNLVSNIGLSHTDATHPGERDHLYEISIYPVTFPLRHPLIVERNLDADLCEAKIFLRFTLKDYIKRYLQYFGIDSKIVKWIQNKLKNYFS